MANERFLKFIPSEEAFWLMTEKPNAFRLLTHIANTARWKNGNPDGLSIGQCHLQHWTFYKLSEQEYRTAKEILTKRKHIIIIETNRTRKKSTTGTTTASTLVQICSTTIYDINTEHINDRINDRATTDQRLTNDKLESIRQNKKDKTYMSDSIEVGLANYFFKQIQTFLPNAKPPNVQIWAKDIDAIIRIDKRSADDVKKYIEWMTSFGCWWQGKVLSPAKLRDQWDTLTAAMQKPQKSSLVDENKKHAELALNQLVSKTCYIEITPVEIFLIPTLGEGAKPISIKFSQSGFKNAVNQELQKKGFKPKNQSSKVSPMPQIQTEVALPEHNEA